MIENKYEKNLIDNAMYLDTVTQSKGKIKLFHINNKYEGKEFLAICSLYIGKKLKSLQIIVQKLIRLF